LFHSVEHSDHIISFQALAHFDSNTLSRVDVQHLQRAEAGSILELIGNEVDAPGLVRCGCDEALFAMPHRFPLAFWPFLQGQTFLFV
jgi:hypothetical protein